MSVGKNARRTDEEEKQASLKRRWKQQIIRMLGPEWNVCMLDEVIRQS